MVTIDEYTGLVTSEHSDQPKFMAMVSAVTQSLVDLQNSYALIESGFDFDNAIGVQLDQVGQWIGISRYLKNSLPVSFFGFAGQPTASRLGEEGLPDVGTRFREEGEPDYPNSTLSDVDYRLYLRARIAYNVSQGTSASIISALEFIFQTPVVMLTDSGDMSFSIAIGKRLVYAEQVLLYLYSIIPKPAGVRINSRIYFDPNFTFGFEGFPYSLTFGEETQYSTTITQNYYDGTYVYDGSIDYSGQTVTHEFIGPGPVIGGIFAEEVAITI